MALLFALHFFRLTFSLFPCPRRLTSRRLMKIPSRREQPRPQQLASDAVADLLGPLRPGQLADAHLPARGMVFGAAQVVELEQNPPARQAWRGQRAPPGQREVGHEFAELRLHVRPPEVFARGFEMQCAELVVEDLPRVHVHLVADVKSVAWPHAASQPAYAIAASAVVPAIARVIGAQADQEKASALHHLHGRETEAVD